MKRAMFAAAVCVAMSGGGIRSDVVQAFRPAGWRPAAILALGLPLIDVMDLEAAADMAARLKRWEFLLTAAAVPVAGGTGFPLNPIATF
jgi:hypothetical protein